MTALDIRPRFFVAASAFLGALIATGPTNTAHADQLDLSIGSAVRWTHTSSADALSSDDSFGFFSINGGYHLDRIRLPGFELILDGTIERGALSGTTFRRLRSDVSLWSFQVGARARRELASRLSVFGRATLGLQRATVELSDDFVYGRAMKNKGSAGTVYLGVGAEVLPFRKPHRDGDRRTVSVGLRFEVGYLAASSFEVRAHPDDDGDPDAIRIPSTVSSLGQLNLSSLAFRFGLVGRF